MTVTVVDEPSPEPSGISGSTLALVVVLVLAVIAVLAYVLRMRTKQEDVEGGEQV